MIGMGVMLGLLEGTSNSAKTFAEAIGKTIAVVELTSRDDLRITFTDGTGISISDEGQSCCESRYITTDDDLSEYVGAKLVGGVIKDAPDIEDEYGVHEVQFLEIQTDRGVFTMATHNEHNGYYGGFSVRVGSINPRY